MSNLFILRNYAQKAPSTIPSSILFSSSARSITIYDRIDGLESLKTLLTHDKESAKDVLSALNEDAQGVKLEIEQEMQKRYGFKWSIWIGFHGAPSMQTKKHYNSFHPKLGFFLHIDDVLSWFDSEPSYYNEMVKLDQKAYEKLLKEDLVCWKCEAQMKNIPTLKAHLQEEWDKVSKREKGRTERKRKLEEKQTSEIGDHSMDQHAEKKVKHDDEYTS
ncbi:hypothetical protein J3R30DRAFT_3654469 [Lentinula aciculospora]|uniref:Aprataxin C2HE/C2H2/C2HC zinc finger domain-containing protein n=1 Tax=Lentinula aciculospora TaxID=153920 RepID=A0A9W9AQ86_9AGAR|nr:hypothetical protein J3R30DRAFT_3654469 [Lentinula aciculospora]